MARTDREHVKDFQASFQIRFDVVTTIEILYIARSGNAVEGTGMTFVNNFLKPAFKELAEKYQFVVLTQADINLSA